MLLVYVSLLWNNALIACQLEVLGRGGPLPVRPLLDKWAHYNLARLPNMPHTSHIVCVPADDLYAHPTLSSFWAINRQTCRKQERYLQEGASISPSECLLEQSWWVCALKPSSLQASLPSTRSDPTPGLAWMNDGGARPIVSKLLLAYDRVVIVLSFAFN